MNRLWVRLSLAFSGVILIAVLIVVLTGFLLSQLDRPENFRPEFLRAPSGLVEALLTHYQTHQSWAGVEPLLTGAQTTFRLERGGGLSFFLADAQGKIIYHVWPEQLGRSIDATPHLQTLPIQLDNQIVGYLGLVPGSGPRRMEGRGGGPPSPAPPPPVDRVRNLLLMIAVVGGGIGLIFGVLMSRTLTAPLNQLAAGARAIGAGNLSRRVEVSGSAELTEVARAFNEMAETLEQAEQLRRNLVADVAHELRTPLTVLQGNLRAILDEVYPLDKAEVARLYEQTRLLSRLVNDLHELAQAEAKQLPLNLQETDLAQLVEAIGDTFRPAAEAKDVSLATRLPANTPPVRVDAARISQVLHNLLANALRHTPTGGTITISVTPEPETVYLSVIDTGEGIPAEHLSHVFDRFYRIDPARSRDQGGAGLGLAIARAIVEAHGGQIEAASPGPTGQGTRFTFRLPLTSGNI